MLIFAFCPVHDLVNYYFLRVVEQLNYNFILQISQCLALNPRKRYTSST